MGFLDVTVLLEASQPEPRVPWVWFATAVCIVLLIIAAFTGQDHAHGGDPNQRDARVGCHLFYNSHHHALYSS